MWIINYKGGWEGDLGSVWVNNLIKGGLNKLLSALVFKLFLQWKRKLA